MNKNLQTFLSMAALFFVLSASSATAQPVYSLQWGSAGAGNGQFNAVDGIAIAPNGVVYCCDEGNDRVQYFSPTGTYLGQFAVAGAPLGIAIAPNGNVYVSRYNADIVEYFSPAGTSLGSWGSSGSGNGQFIWPTGVAIAPNGNVYVGDEGNSRVQYFSPTGTYLGQWDVGGSVSMVTITTGGTVYVGDFDNSLIKYYSLTGTLQGQFGGSGSGDGQFAFIWGIAISQEGAQPGEVYVTDRDNDRVQYFSMTGTYLGQWGSYGSGDGQFDWPSGIAISGQYIYVGEQGGCRVQRFVADWLVIPTLPQWGLIIMGALIAALGGWFIYRKIG